MADAVGELTPERRAQWEKWERSNSDRVRQRLRAGEMVLVCDGDFREVNIARAALEKTPMTSPTDLLQDDDRCAGGCGCIDRVDALLKEQNLKVSRSISFGGAGPRAIVETARLVPGRRISGGPLVANFCPFCGHKYEANES